jgi:hypothetical protein
LARILFIESANICHIVRKPSQLSEFLIKVSKTLAWNARRIQRGVRSARWTLTRSPAQRPIIVVGCSRAGTTLAYKTLSESHEIGSLHHKPCDDWNDWYDWYDLT